MRKYFMKHFKPINLLFSLALVGYLLLSVTAAHGFTALGNRLIKFALLKKIDKPQWTIGMRYGAGCPPEERQNSKELEQVTTKALQAWLQPLRDMQLARPITDDFRYRWQQDFREGEDDVQGLREVDVRITFVCEWGFSNVVLSDKANPDVFIRRGTKVEGAFISTLTHELGHAIGMGDTYVRKGQESNGGLEKTAGKQPSSLMAAHLLYYPPLGEDDKRGIVWLYKHLYEKQSVDDCFFPDYVFEEESRGCRPVHPLIFEVKYSHPDLALQILDEDPTFDVNAQDAEGFTALHYAVMRGHAEVVERLLTHEDIKPSLRNKQGHSAMQIARKNKLDEMGTLLRKHPLITLTTTWGALKRGQ